MKRLFIVALVVLGWLLLTASTGNSQNTALAIAAVAGVVLPLVLKYVPSAGHYMIAITLVVSLAIAAVAELLTGEIVLSRLQATDAQTLFTTFLGVWGLSQIVYAALTQSPSTAKLVT
jgi:ABC-type glucose/galactose transport system permease subunit